MRNGLFVTQGRSKESVGAFFDALGPQRTALVTRVSADGARWIEAVLVERAPQAKVCLDPFHVVKWACDALDEVRRVVWNQARRSCSTRIYEWAPASTVA